LAERRRLLARQGLASAVVALALVGQASGAASAAPGGDAQIEAGRALFTGQATPPCAICHTLKDAGATGTVGPSLDELRPDEARVAAAVRGGIGAMPSFAATLTDAQIRALARYVSKASGGAP
jgi:cytochrome c6